MTIPLAVLLAFAGWTLLVLTLGVGVHRWTLILTRHAAIADFPADAPVGPDLYRRATRAHLNCIENLPIYAAIAIVAHLVGVHGAAMDGLAITMLVARIVQTSVHVVFPISNRTVSVRFAFYAVQIACMITMGAMTAIA